MSKKTHIIILFFGIMACGWVFGSTIGDGINGGVAGIVLSVVSMLVGMIIWAIYAHGMYQHTGSGLQANREEAEKELADRITKMVERQTKISQKAMLVFGEALSKKCVIRMISLMAPEENRAHLYEQAEAIIEEEVLAVGKRQKA